MIKTRAQRRRNALEGLERLARHHGLTKRETVEKLLIQADWAMWKILTPNTPEWDEYFGEQPRIH